MFIARLLRILSSLSYCAIYVISRCERLEEQLNDLTELHQNEILNLKQELASMEEKIAYQSYERARDIQVGERNKGTQVLSFPCSCCNSFAFEILVSFNIWFKSL